MSAITQAQGIFSNCGPGVDTYELSYNCKGPSCSSISGFQKINCNTDGGDAVSCSSETKCPPGISSYYSNFTFSQNAPDPLKPIPNGIDDRTQQNQQVILPNCKTFTVKSDGSKEGTKVDEGGPAAGCPYKVKETPSAIAGNNQPKSTSTAGSNQSKSTSTTGNPGPSSTEKPEQFTGISSRARPSKGILFLTFLLGLALLLPSVEAYSPPNRERRDELRARAEVRVRAVSDKVRTFAQQFGDDLAAKANAQGNDGNTFAHNLVADVISSVCGGYFKGESVGTFTPTIVGDCIKSIYGGDKIPQPGTQFLAVFGASLLCDYAVSEAYPVAEEFYADGCEGLQDLATKITPSGTVGPSNPPTEAPPPASEPPASNPLATVSAVSVVPSAVPSNPPAPTLSGVPSSLPTNPSISAGENPTPNLSSPPVASEISAPDNPTPPSVVTVSELSSAPAPSDASPPPFTSNPSEPVISSPSDILPPTVTPLEPTNIPEVTPSVPPPTSIITPLSTPSLDTPPLSTPIEASPSPSNPEVDIPIPSSPVDELPPSSIVNGTPLSSTPIDNPPSSTPVEETLPSSTPTEEQPPISEVPPSLTPSEVVPTSSTPTEDIPSSSTPPSEPPFSPPTTETSASMPDTTPSSPSSPPSTTPLINNSTTVPPTTPPPSTTDVPSTTIPEPPVSNTSTTVPPSSIPSCPVGSETPDFCLPELCTDLRSDASNCGACNRTCEHSCFNGTCTCPDGQVLNETFICVNMTTTDPPLEPTPCPTNSTFDPEISSCVPEPTHDPRCDIAVRLKGRQVPSWALTWCGEWGCVDTGSDQYNCGSCGTVCEYQCYKSTCYCPRFELPDENGHCSGLDERPSPTPSPIACPSGTIWDLELGNCTQLGVPCPSGQIADSLGNCVDIPTTLPPTTPIEPSHSTTPPSTPTTPPGLPSETPCPREMPFTCSGACVDLTTDPSNCGECGAVCAGTCSNSNCTINEEPGPSTTLVTPPPTPVTIAPTPTATVFCPDESLPHKCEDRCVNFSSDFNNCNGCGKSCSVGQYCENYQCKWDLPADPVGTFIAKGFGLE